MRITWAHAALWLPYFPLGLLTMIIRIFIYPHALLASVVLFPCGALKRSVLRVMCVVLGSIVWIDGSEPSHNDRKRLPVVSNHISLFDHLMLCLSADYVTPHANVFHWCSTFVDLKGEPVSSLVEKTLQKNMSSVHLLPEQKPSEFQEYMRRFDSTPFEYLEKVQPVALKVYRPIPIKLVEYPLNWFVELLWHLFVPFTIYYITYLEPMSRLPNECSTDFAQRVRSVIALAVGASLQDADSNGADNETTMEDKNETYLSNPLSNASPSSCHISTPSSFNESSGLRFRGSPTGGSSSLVTPTGEVDVFDHLIPIVQEVLHLTSVQQIKKALIATDGDVDAAIDMLATSEHEQSVQIPTPHASLIPASRMNVAAETFHSNSNARQSSLIERRKKLMEHARQRFVIHQAKTA
ncbi:unnamed protein product [Dicrocoelium dendriticum]|nr:unnamed protein product [Dicrocoelium dendriticum]